MCLTNKKNLDNKYFDMYFVFNLLFILKLVKFCYSSFPVNQSMDLSRLLFFPFLGRSSVKKMEVFGSLECHYG